MKPIGGHGEPVQRGVFTAEELLRYAMSLPVATTISGVSELPILEQNLRIAQNFTPLSPLEMQALRDRAKPYAGDGHFELAKLRSSSTTRKRALPTTFRSICSRSKSSRWFTPRRTREVRSRRFPANFLLNTMQRNRSEDLIPASKADQRS